MIRRDPAPWILGVLTVATRVPFVPRNLYDFDAAAFAEALTSFEPLRFHPHPPGYTFYVVAAKALHALGLTPPLALAGVSILASVATVVTIYAFGQALAGRRAGVVAALLYLASPLAWTYGAVQGTYGVGAACAAAIAYGAWRRLEGAGTSGPALALGAGLAAGFRPDTALVLAPLLLVAVVLAPDSPSVAARVRQLLGALAAGAAGLALWIAPAASAAGSWSGYRTAVARQWEVVAFSNAQDQFSALLFHVVNVVKVLVYGGFALGPVGALLFVICARRTWRSIQVSPSTKVVLFTWLGGYLVLAGGVAFGQPGMLLTALPAACLTMGVGLTRALPLDARVASLRWAAAAFVLAAASFLWAPGLGHRAFFAARASLPAKVSTELELFTAPGIDLVDRSFGDAFALIRERHAPRETVIITNVASFTRAVWALPEYRVACYFAFAGFDSRLPARDIGEPLGRWALPGGTRWLVVLDADRHALALEDQVVERWMPGTPIEPHAVPEPPGVLATIPVADVSEIRFHAGRIELLRDEVTAAKEAR